MLGDLSGCRPGAKNAQRLVPAGTLPPPVACPLGSCSLSTQLLGPFSGSASRPPSSRVAARPGGFSPQLAAQAVVKPTEKLATQGRTLDESTLLDDRRFSSWMDPSSIDGLSAPPKPTSIHHQISPHIAGRPWPTDDQRAIVNANVTHLLLSLRCLWPGLAAHPAPHTTSHALSLSLCAFCPLSRSIPSYTSYSRKRDT